MVNVLEKKTINSYYALEHCQLHNWEQWSQWTNIQQSCGSQTRTQKISTLAKYGGESCKDRFDCANKAINSVCLNEKRTIKCPG